jgi:thiamine biosynthesis lipoprotein
MKISWFGFLVIVLLFGSCVGDSGATRSPKKPLKLYKISGATMGTTYNITSDLSSLNQTQEAIDQLLVDINHEVSTYEEDSYITLFNEAEDKILLQNTSKYEIKYPHFKKNFEVAQEVYKSSQGYFDPTVLPMVNYWGFGPNKKKPEEVDVDKLKALRDRVGFSKVSTKLLIDKKKQYLVKEQPGIQLDFSALAKGYAVDEVADLLEDTGAKHYLIEIGGEVKVKGNNQKTDFWTIGINKPTTDAALNSVYKKAQLSDVAMASSGNYRNYFELDGQLYSHTLNPKTGYPERNEILSATVFAPDCIIADAYATACMVAGLSEARKIIEAQDGIEAFFIYTDNKGVMSELVTDGASSYIAN